MTEYTTAYWFRAFADAVEQYGYEWPEAFELQDSQLGWSKRLPKHLLFEARVRPEYIRHAPRRIKISGPGGEYSYPEPLREEPRYDADLYVASPTIPQLFVHYSWSWSENDHILLRRGRLHASREAAIEHAKAEILAGGGTL